MPQTADMPGGAGGLRARRFLLAATIWATALGVLAASAGAAGGTGASPPLTMGYDAPAATAPSQALLGDADRDLRLRDGGGALGDTTPAGSPKAGAEGAAGVPSETELAKKAQNPVADLISLPFQYNLAFETGPHSRRMHTLNIQPVVPIHLNEEWNLIWRTILPVTGWPDGGRDQNEFGLGDLNTTLFLSPAKPGKVIWGLGPILQFPTGADPVLGSGKWGAGPSAVLVTMQGPWVIGSLVSNTWSYAGLSNREDVNQFLLQPFINYNLPKGWYLAFSPIITANWKADRDQRWTVPVGGGVGRVFQIGRQPVSFSVAAYYNVERPDLASVWCV